MSTNNPPLTFDLDTKLLDKIQSFQKKAKANSMSQVIRYAVTNFKYSKFKKERSVHKQVSVRLPLDFKNELFKISKDKKVSVGELLRVALEELCSGTPKPQVINEMSKVPVKKKAVKKAAKKSTVKKAVKKKVVKKKKVAPKKKVVTRKKAAPKTNIETKEESISTPEIQVQVPELPKKKRVIIKIPNDRFLTAEGWNRRV